MPPCSVWPIRSVGVAASAAPSDDLPSDRAPIIRRYLNRVPRGCEGTDRSTKLFNIARWLRNAMQCDEREALGVLRAWNNGNTPPLDEAKVVATWKNSGTYNTRLYARRTGARYAA